MFFKKQTVKFTMWIYPNLITWKLSYDRSPIAMNNLTETARFSTQILLSLECRLHYAATALQFHPNYSLPPNSVRSSCWFISGETLSEDVFGHFLSLANRKFWICDLLKVASECKNPSSGQKVRQVANLHCQLKTKTSFSWESFQFES